MTTFDTLRPGDPGLASAPDDLARARHLLATAALAGAEQEALRERAMAFCDDHPDALHRRCTTGHLTGAAVVIDPTTGRTLLIHHAKLDRWLQPGGHADGDGNLAAVAWREASEETGLGDLRVVTPAIHLDIHEIPARGDESAHLHLDLRFCVVAEGDLTPRPNDEALAARWVDPGAPEVTASAELAEAVARALAVVR